MSEVIIKPDHEHQEEEYPYVEPPRDSVVSEHKPVSRNTIDSSVIQSEYPRITNQYDYSEPPRDSLHTDPSHDKHEEAKPVSAEVIITNVPAQVIEPQPIQYQLKIDDHSQLNLKERLKAKKIPDQLNIHSFILMLIGSQNIFLLGCLFVIQLMTKFGLTFIIDFLLLVFWIPYVALGVYAVVYLVVWKFESRISISASSFFLIQICISCEAIFLVYAHLKLGIELKFLFYASFQLIGCVYTAAFVAQCMKKSYTGIIGRLIAMGPCLVIMAFYIAFVMETLDILIYIIITLFVGLYIWFLITKIDEFVEKLGGRDTMLAGIFCSLLVIKKKVEWVLRIIIFPYSIYLMIQGDPPQKKNPEIIEPLLEQPGKIN